MIRHSLLLAPAMGVVAHLVMGALPRLSHPDPDEPAPEGEGELPPVD